MEMRRALRKNIFLILTVLISFIITFYSSTVFLPNQKELNSTSNQASSIKTQLNDYKRSLENTISNINLLKNQNKTELKDPTYNQVLSFIINDTTNENTYHDTDYNCVHFSTDVNNNAEEQDIRCAYVELILNNNYPHAIVAFNTTDKGLIFFEPQLDEIAQIEIGKDYWQDCLENSTSHGSGNIILDYILYW
jgi:regulatory protein YycH of two-component signal transduction system YycFG